MPLSPGLAVGKCECGKWLGFELNDIRVIRFDRGPITLGVCPTCARLHALHHSTSMLVEDRAPKNAATIPSSEKR